MTEKKEKKPRKQKSVKGSADIFVRSDGFYGCRWTATLPDGSTKRISLCAKTEEEIVSKRNAKIQELAKGEYVCKNNIVFKEWSKKWLEEYKRISLSPTTYETYETLLDTHIIPRIGHLQLQKITHDNIQKCINTIARKSSPSTVKQIASIVRQCFGQAMDNRLISFSPAERIKLPKMKTLKPRKAFTDEELQKLINVAKIPVASNANSCFYPALVLMIETGCRKGEILGLKWKNVNIDDSTILIQDTIVQVDGKPFKKDDPKNNNSIRLLPILKETMELLKSIKGDALEESYVFHVKSGEPISPRNFNRRFEQWCIAAGLCTKEICGVDEKGKEIIKYHATHSPHELRHTFITNMVDNGESAATIQSLTGHSTLRILMNYTHKVSESVNKAVKKRQTKLQKIICPIKVEKKIDFRKTSRIASN